MVRRRRENKEWISWLKAAPVRQTAESRSPIIPCTHSYIPHLLSHSSQSALASLSFSIFTICVCLSTRDSFIREKVKGGMRTTSVCKMANDCIPVGVNQLSKQNFIPNEALVANNNWTLISKKMEPFPRVVTPSPQTPPHTHIYTHSASTGATVVLQSSK